MKAIKKIVAAALAAVSIGAIGVTAAAETIYDPPVNWKAVHQNGAPSSVNKKYLYPMYVYGGGFDITCTEFEGDYDRKVTVWKQYNMRVNGEIETYDSKIDEIHAETISPIFASSPIYTIDNMVTFAFYATSAANCRAYGEITHH